MYIALNMIVWLILFYGQAAVTETQHFFSVW